MSERLRFEDLALGQRWTSKGRTILESDIARFAGLTGDFDPLHVDHESARRGPFRKPIAHGLLGMSILAGLSSEHPDVQTMAFVAVRDWEFRRPIFVGDTVRAVVEVDELHAQGRRNGRVVWRRTLLNQRDEVVQTGLFETLVARRAPAGLRHDEPHSSPTRPGIESASEREASKISPRPADPA